MKPDWGRVGRGRARRQTRVSSWSWARGSALLALLLLLSAAPLLAPLPAVAQEESPAIVPAAGDEGDVSLDPTAGEAVAADEVVLDPGTQFGDDASVDLEEAPSLDVAAPELDESVAVAPPPSAAAGTPDLDWAPPRTVYIPETGQSVDGVFLDVWRAWGGALSWGNPITPEIEQDGRLVQYYAYGRFEYVPDDPGGNVVHFGDLGAEARPYVLRRESAPRPGQASAVGEAAAIARAWLPLEPAMVEADGAEWRFVPETGHGVAGPFKAFWEATGEASYLGNPLTEQFQAEGVTAQVFERGKLVQEPGGSPYLVPIGEVMAARFGLDTAPVGQGDLPAYSEELFVPPPPPTPVPTAGASDPGVVLDPNAERWFEVSIGQQYGWARQGDVVLWEGYLSTGKESFETPTGTFFVNSKLPVQDMEGVLGGEYYNVPEVPDVMYFTDRGHAIHGTYWHNNFGVPMSHGCINLPMDVADWIYGWAPMGMRVEIRP